MSNANDPSFHGIALLGRDGQRKYLCATEAASFLAAADVADAPTRLFARLLAHSGCRISEALAVTPRHLDPGERVVIFRTLKRRRLCYRVVPLPDTLMAELLALARAAEPTQRLWPWGRQTAWRRIKRLMAEAGIAGPQATPKGLRHRFGVLAAERVPLPLAQRWLGHAKPETTAIYQQAVGQEERRMMEKMWGETIS